MKHKLFYEPTTVLKSLCHLHNISCKSYTCSTRPVRGVRIHSKRFDSLGRPGCWFLPGFKLMTGIRHQHTQSHITVLWVTAIHTEFLRVNTIQPSVCLPVCALCVCIDVTLDLTASATRNSVTDQSLSLNPQSTSTSRLPPQIPLIHTDCQTPFVSTNWQFPRKWGDPLVLQQIDLNKSCQRLAPTSTRCCLIICNCLCAFVTHSSFGLEGDGRVWREGRSRNKTITVF